tara:strand:- start:1236 stop:1541 length:306 start_codon:yes stop_codon:yes gene_type:complete
VKHKRRLLGGILFVGAPVAAAAAWTISTGYDLPGQLALAAVSVLALPAPELAAAAAIAVSSVAIPALVLLRQRKRRKRRFLGPRGHAHVVRRLSYRPRRRR